MFWRRRRKNPRRFSSRSGSGSVGAAPFSTRKRSYQSLAIAVGQDILAGVMIALVEARESLDYWERRLQTLPRRAVRQRREAREMAARWRQRVDAAELAEYGPGLIGTLFMLVSERRMPMRTQHTGAQLVRVGKMALLTTAAFAATLMTLLCIAI